MCVYVRCEARQETQVTESVLRQIQVLNKANFLFICVSEKCHSCMFRRNMSCEKWVQYIFW